MPIPFLLIGAAAVVGAYGAKKTADAVIDTSKAKSLTDEANEIQQKAEKRLTSARDSAKNNMDRLGKQKFNAFNDVIVPFADHFRKIKNIHVKDYDNNPCMITTNELKVSEFTSHVMEMKDVLVSGVSGLGAGGLAGLAVYGGVGALASASTGTAIAGLSGAAATNATLAWLGGGSLATGGMGMAGGAMVLGGIVAAPVLAIAGGVWASKAAGAREEAQANLSLAKKYAADMDNAAVLSLGLAKHFGMVRNVIERLTLIVELEVELFISDLEIFGYDYISYPPATKERIMKVLSLVMTLKNIIDQPLIDKNGKIIGASTSKINELASNISKLLGVYHVNK